MKILDSNTISPISQVERDAVRRAALAWAQGYGKAVEDRSLSPRLRWRPHIYCTKERLAIHLLLYPGITDATVRSFKDAVKRVKGLRIAIAGPERFLRFPAVLHIAAEVNASIAVFRQDDQVAEYGNVREAIYKEKLLLPPETYKALAQETLRKALAARAQEKGRILESLVALLLSQVAGFAVKETNYNTMTEEIDVVVQNCRIGGIFAAYQEPLVLVECKNQDRKAGKNEYVSLATKIRNRRHAASIGLFVSVNGYTEDFIQESLRNSHQKLVVARLTRAHLDQWVNLCGEKAASFLETLIEEAALE